MIVKDLFHDLPVRLIEFKKTYKQQFAKAIQLMQAYAVIMTDTRLNVLSNQGENMPFAMVLKTNPQGKYEAIGDLKWTKIMGQNILAVLGKQKFS